MDGTEMVPQDDIPAVEGWEDFGGVDWNHLGIKGQKRDHFDSGQILKSIKL